jgi:hypothetical protein
MGEGDAAMRFTNVPDQPERPAENEPADQWLLRRSRRPSQSKASPIGELATPSQRWAELNDRRNVMGFGRGVLLWLIGIPIPIIILIALFWHH